MLTVTILPEWDASFVNREVNISRSINSDEKSTQLVFIAVPFDLEQFFRLP